MIQQVGFSAGNWNRDKVLHTASAKAVIQGVLREMTNRSSKIEKTVDLITLTPRGSFKGTVHQG